MAENYKPKRRNRYPDTESIEVPGQDGPKQTNTKTYYNQNGKSERQREDPKCTKKKNEELIIREYP